MLAISSLMVCTFTFTNPRPDLSRAQSSKGHVARREVLTLLGAAAAAWQGQPAFAARAGIESSSYYSEATLIPSPTAAKRFEGKYDDLLHPGCERQISVREELLTNELNDRKYYEARFSGTDVVPKGIDGLLFAACTEDSMNESGRTYTVRGAT
jgi:hypothetical protein